jgi:asparagine synthase (glutamine-hydrolysing)
VRIRYRNEDDYADHFAELMKRSVEARLRSFRPAGLLLSGGVDSGTIAATAGWLAANGRLQNKPGLRAYSFAWDELSECGERHISRPLAEQCGLSISEVPADDAWPLKPGSEALVDPETPFLHGHYVLLERACQQARAEGIGLMLSGDRGDLVGGMNLYDWPSLLWSGRWISLLREMRTISRWNDWTLWQPARRVTGRTLREAASFHRRTWGSLPPFRRFATPAARNRWPAWLSAEMIEHAREAQEATWVEPVPPFPSSAVRERYRLIFMDLHMHGIESSERMHARQHQGFADPWSDRRIVEFACQVPQRVLNRVGEPKRLVRRALKNLLPAHFATSMQKIVPTPLFDRGLRENGQPVALSLIHDSLAARQGLIDQKQLHDAYQALCERRPASVAEIWRALSFELWLRQGPG